MLYGKHLTPYPCLPNTYNPLTLTHWWFSTWGTHTPHPTDGSPPLAHQPINLHLPTPCPTLVCIHDDVIKWKHFPLYWPFARGIHRSPVNSPHKGQWRGALMFSLTCAWLNACVNNRAAGDLRRHRAHYDVIVMVITPSVSWIIAIVSAFLAIPSIQPSILSRSFQPHAFTVCLSTLFPTIALSPHSPAAPFSPPHPPFSPSLSVPTFAAPVAAPIPLFLSYQSVSRTPSLSLSHSATFISITMTS